MEEKKISDYNNIGDHSISYISDNQDNLQDDETEAEYFKMTFLAIKMIHIQDFDNTDYL